MILRQHSDRGDEPRATVRAWDDARERRGRDGRRRRFHRTPAARMRGAALRPEGKFSALQSLEKSQNAERISIRVGSCVAVSEEAAAESIVDISNRGVASPRSRRERPTESPANGRNALKRLNLRPEMVWARKPRTYNIWYTGARLTGGGSGVGQNVTPKNRHRWLTPSADLHSLRIGGRLES